jgi:hypothetical protein
MEGGTQFGFGLADSGGQDRASPYFLVALMTFCLRGGGDQVP